MSEKGGDREEMSQRPSQIDIVISDEVLVVSALKELIAHCEPEALERLPGIVEAVIELEMDTHELEYVSLNEREAAQKLRLGHVDRHLVARRTELDQWQPCREWLQGKAPEKRELQRGDARDNRC